jgi:hypothetical protein
MKLTTVIIAVMSTLVLIELVAIVAIYRDVLTIISGVF